MRRFVIIHRQQRLLKWCLPGQLHYFIAAQLTVQALAAQAQHKASIGPPGHFNIVYQDFDYVSELALRHYSARAHDAIGTLTVLIARLQLKYFDLVKSSFFVWLAAKDPVCELTLHHLMGFTLLHLEAHKVLVIPSEKIRSFGAKLLLTSAVAARYTTTRMGS